MVKLYKPPRSWWREVRKLEEILFFREEPQKVHTLGRFASINSIMWREPGAVTAFFSMRRLGQPIVSAVLSCESCVEEDGQNLHSLHLVREAIYRPSLFTSSRHQRTEDMRGAYYDIHGYFEDGKTIDESIAQLRRIRQSATQQQRESGLSLPNEETYDFILTSLRNGEEQTRPHDDGLTDGRIHFS